MLELLTDCCPDWSVKLNCCRALVVDQPRTARTGRREGPSALIPSAFARSSAEEVIGIAESAAAEVHRMGRLDLSPR